MKKNKTPSQKVTKKKIVIFGGSGFLAKNLSCKLISLGYSVVAISRNFPSIQKRFQKKWQNYDLVKKVNWDGQKLGDWVKELEGCYAIVNTVGRSVDCIKNLENCDDILRSRVDSIRLVSEALKKIKKKPTIWAQAATAHIYGDPPKVICNEESIYGYGLAPFVAEKWEEALEKYVPSKIRKVTLRISLVVGLGGGALQKLLPIARLGLGGTSGHGRQGMSWIHEDDITNLFIRGIENSKMKGAYIASSPFPVSNKIFMKTLRKAAKIPFGLFAPSFLIRFVAKYILKTDADLILLGRYCVSKRLADENFQFQFPQLKDALENLLKKK